MVRPIKIWASRGRSEIVVTACPVGDPDSCRAALAEGLGGTAGVGSKELVANVGPVHESNRFQHRMEPELAEQVLDMRSSRLRTDDERFGDGPVGGSLREESEDLPLPAGELGKLSNGVVTGLPAPLELLEKVAEHGGRNDRVASMDRSSHLEQLLDGGF